MVIPAVAPIPIFIVDDHSMILDSLQTALMSYASLQILGGATEPEEALRRVTELQPKVVLLDICLPGRGSFELARDLINLKQGTRILLLSGFLADVFVAQSLKMRLSGYILKGESLDFLVDAIHRAADGQTVYSPAVEERVVFDESQQRFVARYETDLAALTPRQVEVLRHLACGQSVKEIAKIMHLSQKSVDSHKYRIMNKLGIHDRVELARFAIREGLMVP